MDLYQEIVNLLGLDSKPNTIEDVEQKILDELRELNETYRSLDVQIQETENYLEELREKVDSYNQRAIKMIKQEDEPRARRVLEEKQVALNRIQEKEKDLARLRRNIDRIESRRRDLADMLQRIRDRRRR